MKVITRFAPSPTGFLHIGGARTALFNWLYAKHHEGKFLLRVEDTDLERSTQEAIDAIQAGLSWLGLDADGEVVFQSKNIERHKEVVKNLVKEGKAYYCYTPAEELQSLRDEARQKGENFRYRSPWRDVDAKAKKPEGVDPVIRLKAPSEGEISIEDQVQGKVSVSCLELDDMVLTRSDGTPTYMLAVVVDDHDMNITHVIRGDDHLTNSFRQSLIFNALGWEVPVFAHIPLIHGEDGTKLSKRHGALSVEAYKDMGILPEAMINYLLRLGWSNGDDEIFSLRKAIELFDIDNVGKSPSRFDMDRLMNLNQHYIIETENERLAELIIPYIQDKLERKLDDDDFVKIVKSLQGLKQRSKNLNDLAESSIFYLTTDFFDLDDKSKKIIKDVKPELLQQLVGVIEGVEAWKEEVIEEQVRNFIDENNLKFGEVGQPLRVTLTGTLKSPGLFEVIQILGKKECVTRLKAYL